MNRKLVFVLYLFVFLSSLVLYVRFTHVEVKSPTGYPVHNLDTGLNYTSIQEAINAPETLDGHTVLVEDGMYFGNILLNKSLTLHGENREHTIIDGNGTGTVVHIIADNVILKNFTIRNAGLRPFIGGNPVEACVFINGSDRIILQENILQIGQYGVVLWPNCNDSIIKRNIIFDHTRGISLGYQSRNILVLGNHIYHQNRTAISTTYSENITIQDNTVYDVYRWGGNGMQLVGNDNVEVIGNRIENTSNGNGIYINACNNTAIDGNSFVNNVNGIELSHLSNDNTFSGNKITNNKRGIYIHFFQGSPTNNTISGNNITDNEYGVYLDRSDRNKFYHNNFVRNIIQVHSLDSVDYWDDNYPSAGNYWSDYTGIDADGDGIGDTAYVIDENNRDNYPLMGMFSSFNTSLGYGVNVISNSTIEDFQYFESNSTIKITVSNMTANQTHGYCRLTIPHDLLSPTYNVIINGTVVPYAPVFENETLSIIYFSYEHSTLEIIVIPEFPSFLVLPLFMIATLLTVIVYRKKSHTIGSSSVV